MILCDVGVLLSALIEKAPHHQVCRRELDGLWMSPGEIAVSELILAAVVRVWTNPNVFRPCPTAADMFGFVGALMAPADVRRASPGPRHWSIFRDLVLAGGITGGDTTDA